MRLEFLGGTEFVAELFTSLKITIASDRDNFPATAVWGSYPVNTVRNVIDEIVIEDEGGRCYHFLDANQDIKRQNTMNPQKHQNTIN